MPCRMTSCAPRRRLLRLTPAHLLNLSATSWHDADIPRGFGVISALNSDFGSQQCRRRPGRSRPELTAKLSYCCLAGTVSPRSETDAGAIAASTAWRHKTRVVNAGGGIQQKGKAWPLGQGFPRFGLQFPSRLRAISLTSKNRERGKSLAIPRHTAINSPRY